jgi:prepilin-type N-terminal cleavage/methylation domain-containing protein
MNKKTTFAPLQILKRTRKFKSSAGFTLLEVLMTTAIMVSVLGVLVYGLSQCSNLTQIMRSQDIAVNALQEKLEEIANSDISQIMGNYNGQTFDIAGLTPDPAGSVVVTQIGAVELYDVTVTANWQQGNGRQLSRALNITLVQK